MLIPVTQDFEYFLRLGGVASCEVSQSILPWASAQTCHHASRSPSQTDQLGNVYFTNYSLKKNRQITFSRPAETDEKTLNLPPVCISPPPTSHLTDLLPTVRNITTDIRPEEITRLISGLILAKKSTLSLSSFCAFNLYAPRRFVEGV